MSFTDEERKVLLDSAIKKLEESAKTFKNEIFSSYPHGLAYGLEQQMDSIRMHHRKPFDFDDEYAEVKECEREQKEEVQSRANLDEFMKKLEEIKLLLEKCHAYLPVGDNLDVLVEIANKTILEECTAHLHLPPGVDKDEIIRKLNFNKLNFNKIGISNKLCELECDVKMCEATLAYIGKLVEIAGTWKKLYDFMSNISSNDR